MNIINAENMQYKELNKNIKDCLNDCRIKNCLGQRFIATGLSDKNIVIDGTPGNALGAYLNGAKITVNGNAQDAVGDTMNDGEIIIHGNIGDAVGYAMRGGKIFIQGNAGYRAGIHMKAYKDKIPVIIIGGKAGSFLGEYQAGGLIIVLGIGNDNNKIIGNFPCTGMHGGQMLLRSSCENIKFPKNVKKQELSQNELGEFTPHIKSFCQTFGLNIEEILNSKFTLITPDSKNPYKQMYIIN